MMIFLNMMLGLDVVSAAFLVYFTFRATWVADFRIELVDKLFKFHDWQWRQKKYNTVSFQRMVYSFKPLKPENYYDDTSFLEPSTAPIPSPIKVVRL